jgi:hypothetical protein
VAIDLSTRCRRSESIVYRQIGTEAVLVPIRGNAADLESIYTLNEVGHRIWDLLDGNKTVAQLCAAVAAEFEVEPTQARKDVVEFLGELLALKVVEVV